MTPTKRQITELHDLPIDDLVQRALLAMHALNRRTKEKRDRRNEFRRMRFSDAIEKEIERIYRTKDAFLEALVESGRATVGHYTVPGGTRTTWLCCDRTWGGPDGECRRCGGMGDGQIERDAGVTWFLVVCGDYSWHSPAASNVLTRVATPIPPHDPTQPQREIPDTGLTIEAQMAAVRLATQRLKGRREEGRAHNL